MNRPKVTQQVIDTFAQFLDDQDAKGYVKYGVTINEAKNEHYDWNVMALEELADFTKYMAKKNQRLRDIINDMKFENEELSQLAYHLEKKIKHQKEDKTI